MAREAFKSKSGYASDAGRENFAFENFQGVDVISDNTALPKKMIPFAKNADFSKRIGAVGKRDGIKKLFTSLGTGGCIGIHNYRSAAGDRVLFGWGNTLYKLAGTSNTLIKTTQADWQAGTGYNIDLTGIPGDIKLAVAPTNSFVRATAAYKKDGSQAASGAVRYEAGLFSNGVFIEEGATNLITNPLFTTDLTSWNQASNADFSYAGTGGVRQTDGGAIGAAYVKCGDGTNTGKGIVTASNVTVTAGGSYTLSTFLKVANLGSQAILLIRTKDSGGANNSATVTPPSGWVYTSTYDALYTTITHDTLNTWKRFNSVFTVPTGVASVQISIQFYTGGDKYISIGAIQFENKKYATSFINGTRDPEFLNYTIPALPTEFLTGGVFKPEWGSTATDISGGFSVLTRFKADASNYYDVMFITQNAHANKGKLLFQKTVGGAVNGELASTALTYNAGDSIRWAAAQLTQTYNDLLAGMYLWVRVNDGAVQRFSLTNTATASNITACYVGQNSSGSFVNGTIDNVFVENIAARNPIGQVLNDQSVKDILNSGSAYSVSAATTLHVSGDNTITAPRCPGMWLSPSYDLGSNPELASITWTANKPANTDYSVKIRSSSDNITFGVWQLLSSGGSIPLLRYHQIKVDQSTTDPAATPAFSDFTISYESSLNQAVAIKNGLPGTKIRFTNYDNKCYWCAGGRLQVFDGTTNRDVGTDLPATAPTIAAGAGTGLTGKYKAAVTFVTDTGHESNPSPYSARTY